MNTRVLDLVADNGAEFLLDFPIDPGILNTVFSHFKFYSYISGNSVKYCEQSGSSTILITLFSELPQLSQGAHHTVPDTMNRAPYLYKPLLSRYFYHDISFYFIFLFHIVKSVKYKATFVSCLNFLNIVFESLQGCKLTFKYLLAFS